MRATFTTMARRTAFTSRSWGRATSVSAITGCVIFPNCSEKISIFNSTNNTARCCVQTNCSVIGASSSMHRMTISSRVQTRKASVTTRTSTYLPTYLPSLLELTAPGCMFGVHHITMPGICSYSAVRFNCAVPYASALSDELIARGTQVLPSARAAACRHACDTVRRNLHHAPHGRMEFCPSRPLPCRSVSQHPTPAVQSPL